MNEEHRSIAGIKKRNVASSHKVSALDDAAPQPTLILGRAAHPNPNMGIGLAEFWFGRKKNCRQSP
jgi:hypothetical protein